MNLFRQTEKTCASFYSTVWALLQLDCCTAGLAVSAQPLQPRLGAVGSPVRGGLAGSGSGWGKDSSLRGAGGVVRWSLDSPSWPFPMSDAYQDTLSPASETVRLHVNLLLQTISAQRSWNGMVERPWASSWGPGFLFTPLPIRIQVKQVSRQHLSSYTACLNRGVFV